MLELPISIENFNTELGEGMGGYGPSIVLAGSVVAAILGLSIKRDESLTADLLNRIHHSLPQNSGTIGQVEFHEDSWLLLGVWVGRTGIAVDGDKRAAIHRGVPGIRYNPYNIDAPEQSWVLFSTWLLWFNRVAVGVGLKRPVAI